MASNSRVERKPLSLSFGHKNTFHFTGEDCWQSQNTLASIQSNDSIQKDLESYSDEQLAEFKKKEEKSLAELRDISDRLQLNTIFQKLLVASSLHTYHEQLQKVAKKEIPLD